MILLTLIQGNRCVYWSENRICTNFPASGSGKYFQASGMIAIDSPHKITLRKMILRQETQNVSIFASIQTFISLNQGQGSIFKIRECAQSIPRIKLPSERWFWGRNFKIFDFRFNTHIFFPESGSRKYFLASGMRAIDFSHKITPRKVFFEKKFEKFFFHPNLPQKSVPPLSSTKSRKLFNTNFTTLQAHKNVQNFEYP